MLEYAGITENGSREINEDSINICETKNGNVFVVCDGLGGHGGGEVASDLAIKAVQEVFENENLTTTELTNLAVNKANEAIMNLQKAQRKMNEYKTTITLLSIKVNNAVFAHCGDSRIYTFTKHKLTAQTLDHSVPQMLVAQGEIKQSQIRFHEDRNRLIRVLGAGDEVKYTLEEKLITPGQNFLLCSDGFWEWITEKEMSKALKASATPDEWLLRMSQIVKSRGAGKNMDNFSAIAVFYK